MTKLNNQISLKTDQIFRMTDDTGMLQHSVYGNPNLSQGYTTDDNARALIMAVKIYDQHREKSIERLMSKYISFLFYAQNTDGKFKNFMGYNREFLEDEGSEDCFGRCMWALCYTFASPITPKYIKNTAWKMIENALPNCLKLISPRANAYLIIGLKYLNQERLALLPGLVWSLSTEIPISQASETLNAICEVSEKPGKRQSTGRFWLNVEETALFESDLGEV